MNRTLIIIIGAALIVLAVIALPRLFRHGGESSPEAAAPETQVAVKVVRPSAVTDTLSFDVRGRVTARKDHSIAALSEGKILRVSVAVNDPVKKGQLVALLQNAELDSELALQKNKAQLSRETVQALEKKVRNAREMLSLGIISQNDFTALQQELNAGNTELHDQEIALSRLQSRSGNYRVVSDASGYISQILPENSFVAYGQTVAQVISLEDEQIEAFVPFDPVTRPAPGDAAEISSTGLTVPGKVSNSYPSADSNLITVVVTPERPLPLNLNVKVTFRLHAVNGLVIPKTAVVMFEGKPVVYAVIDGIALRKPVTVLKDYLDTVVIANDLGPTPVLATENAYLLADSVRVAVQ